jgi:hypothetical protein
LDVLHGREKVGSSDIQGAYARLVADVRWLPPKVQCVHCKRSVAWRHFEPIKPGSGQPGVCICMRLASPSIWEPCHAQLLSGPDCLDSSTPQRASQSQGWHYVDHGTVYHPHASPDAMVNTQIPGSLTSPVLHAQNTSPVHQEFMLPPNDHYTNPNTTAGATAPSPTDANKDIEMGRAAKKLSSGRSATPRYFVHYDKTNKRSPVQAPQKRNPVANSNIDADIAAQDGYESSRDSYKVQRLVKRGDPPQAHDGKYYCSFALECANQYFDRKCEWRWVEHDPRVTKERLLNTCSAVCTWTNMIGHFGAYGPSALHSKALPIIVWRLTTARTRGSQ